MSELMLEMEENKPPLYRPKGDLASWEMVVSAPVGHLSSSSLGDLSSSSSSISSGISFEEITAVEVNDAKPMTMRVNGEELVVDGSFTFDITPIGQTTPFGGNGSIRRTLGMLTRVKDHQKIHRMALRGNELMGNFPHALQGMLRSGQPERDGFDRPVSHSNQANRESTRSGIPRESNLYAGGERASYSSRHTQAGSMSEDEVRFQGMLNRLHSLPARQRDEGSSSDIQARDPAIIAAKAKNTGIQGTQAETESLITVPGPQHVGWERREEQRSHDSGYASGQSGQSTHVSSTMTAARMSLDKENRKSIDDTAARRLNPAAAEFKAMFNEQLKPFNSPRKMFRPPLTNIFPEAARDMPVRLSNGPEARKNLNMMRAAEETLDSREAVYNSRPPIPEPLAPTDPVGSPPSGLGSCPSGIPGREMYPDMGYHQPQRQIPFDLVSTVNELIKRHLSNMRSESVVGNLGNYGTFPVPGMMLQPNDIGQFPMTNANGFSTYFGTVPAFVPTLEPQRHIGITTTAPLVTPTPVVAPPPGLVKTPPIPYAIYGQPPVLGTDRKIPAPRPHFLVTQKPRDHDPVKQQQYEAYLEWRKANEPGYHMKCKMRQAQRVVRQYQQKQQSSLVNPAYKTIIEQAKAAVAAAAAAAAAEKQAREESVRQELKVKVRERSEGSGHGVVAEEDDTEGKDESMKNTGEFNDKDESESTSQSAGNNYGSAKNEEEKSGNAKDETVNEQLVEV